jgi:acetyl-CoA acetyltransferase
VTWTGAGRVAVAGVGFSPITRRSDRPIWLSALSAVNAAADDSGVPLAEVDGLATYPLAPFAGALNRNGEDVVTPEFFLSMAGLTEVRWYSQAGEGMIVASVSDAANAIIAGACEYALVWRAMYVPPGTYGLADAAAGGDEQFSAPYGCASPIQWHALAYRRYLERFGVKRQALGTLVVNSRRNANLNPVAVFADRTLTVEDYEQARMIADPLCLFDCDVPVTGCVAVLLTSAERARDLRQPPVYLAGVSLSTSPQSPMLSRALQAHLQAGRPTASRLWAQSGLGPAEMSAAQLYDGFAPSAIYWLEAAGFCGPGEALDFIQDGRIALDGQLPVNTAGGSLSEGRLHGMGHIAEAVVQLRRQAAARQVESPHAIAVFDGSPMLRGGGMVFTS